ncbi:MAG: OmpH family outer membrane protein [Acidobacteria bacterium]|nr:OmpH family outer membrane protein [Acidobacteriota bacterium]
MRRAVLSTVLALATVFAAVPVFAGGKVGFVDVERAATTVKEGRAALKKLGEWAKPRRKEIDTLRDKARELALQVQKEQNVAGPQALDALKQRAIAARRRFEDSAREFKRQYDEKQTEFTANVAKKMKQIVVGYAKDHGFDAVFVLKPMMLIYLKDSADLTDAIIQEYDKQYPLKPGGSK